MGGGATDARNVTCHALGGRARVLLVPYVDSWEGKGTCVRSSVQLL